MCYHHLDQYYRHRCDENKGYGDQSYDHRAFPCLQCHPDTYIRMVQHLIERCMLMRMNEEQCTKALAKHAKITPVVTLTVWRGLLKENRDFFHAYNQSLLISPSSAQQTD